MFFFPSNHCLCSVQHRHPKIMFMDTQKYKKKEIEREPTHPDLNGDLMGATPPMLMKYASMRVRQLQ